MEDKKDINETIENSLEEKKKKEKKCKFDIKKVATLLTAIALCIGGYFLISTNQKIENVPATFEVLDESVLSREVFKEWVEKNSQNKGTYTKEDGDVVYAMISYGKTTKPGIGICVEEVKGTKNIEIVYSIIDNNDEREVEENTPKMILKLENKGGKISFKEIEAE